MEKYHRKQLEIGESFICEGFYITIQDITSDYINAYIYKREWCKVTMSFDAYDEMVEKFEKIELNPPYPSFEQIEMFRK